MKRLLVILAALEAIFIATYVAYAARVVYTGPLVNESGLAYNKNYTLNTSNFGIDHLSATVSYSSDTIASQTFTDGTQSTGAITVASVTGLKGTQGTDTLTVLSTSNLSGSSLSIGGVVLTNSIQWYTGISTNTTATSIKNAINTNAPQFVATIGAQLNRVTITCGSSGTWCNNVPLSVIGTSSITAGSANFTGGVDNALVAINGVTLIQGRDWTAVATTTGTAKAISDAIMANASLSAIIQSTWTASSVVTTTSTAVGTSTAYSLSSSSQGVLSLSGSATTDSVGRGTSAMTGGTNSGYSLNSKDITIANNAFYPKGAYAGQAAMLALPVLYSTGAVAIGGLTNQTTYYVIPVDANTIRLASSSTNAQAGTAITLTSSSTQTTAHTYTLASLAISGTPSLKWQASDDGVNWNDVAVSSVTINSYTVGGAASSWDFGSWNYNYVRLAVIGPTQGGLTLLATLNGKESTSR